MSADTPRPDAAEPVDAEFEPAPDSGGSRTKSKPKTPKAAKSSGGKTPVLAFIGLTVLAAGVGGGAGWVLGRYLPASGEGAADPALISRIEALEAQTASTDQLAAIQNRLETVEEETAGAPLRTDAFEQLIRDVATLRTDLEALEPGAGSDAGLSDQITTRLESLERQLSATSDDAQTALAAAQTAQSALQQALAQPDDRPTPQTTGVSPDVVSTLRRDLAALQTAVRALQAEAGDTQRIDALDSRIEGLETQTGQTQTASVSLARQALAFSDLAEAAAQAQPFAMEYAMLSQIWPNRAHLIALTEPARTGAPTLDDLTGSFPAQAVREALGQTQRFWGVIEVRRAGDDHGAADQIVSLLEQGALSEAIRVTEALDAEAAQVPLESWLNEARKREALNAVLDDMRAALNRQAEQDGAR
ncbi:hypothetical protein [Oceanicaulis sp.]|uniref:hypothetical protein n=1 Tax=Oceanicaulis sp. TaxID=1924941 RepID=UPI003D274350